MPFGVLNHAESTMPGPVMPLASWAGGGCEALVEIRGDGIGERVRVRMTVSLGVAVHADPCDGAIDHVRFPHGAPSAPLFIM